MTFDEIMGLKIEFVDNPEFNKTILTSAQMPEGKSVLPRVPKELPEELRHLYRVPLLTREQEIYLFQRMNCVKFLAAQLRVGLRPHYKSRIKYINLYLTEAVGIRNLIVESNLRLVVHFAKRFLGNIHDWISEGNLALIRAVELFDCGKGNKFSTYASYAIKNRLLNALRMMRRREKRYPIEDSNIEYLPDRIIGEAEKCASTREAKEIANKMLQTVSGRERDILVARYGLDGNDPMTLAEIGDIYGITKERVRQILKSLTLELRNALV